MQRTDLVRFADIAGNKDGIAANLAQSGGGFHPAVLVAVCQHNPAAGPAVGPGGGVADAGGCAGNQRNSVSGEHGDLLASCFEIAILAALPL